MKIYSTREAAKELGITHASLSRYISSGKIPSPSTATAGGMTIHLWTEAEIEHVRQLLPKIANGRKTRYQKVRGKTKAQAGVPVPQKQKKAKPKKPKARS
jgi:predicted transcriptional regulator